MSNGDNGTTIGRNEDGTFAVGNPGGPGRPKGSISYKNRVLDSFKTFYLDDIEWLKRYHANFKEAALNPASDPGKFIAERMYAREVVAELDEALTRGIKRDIAFLRYMIYLELFDEQREALLTQKPWIVNIGGRRAGKTRSWASVLVDRCLTHDKGVALYLGRTAKSAFEMIWRPTVETLKAIGVEFEQHISTQSIAFANGVEIQVRGRNSKEDVENLRGKPYFLAVVDEIQSDATEKLRYIVKDILEPAGKDFVDSQIALGGTPPRIPGNYAEEMFLSDRKDICRLNWNMSVNRHIPESERDLEKTRIEKGYGVNDPTWLREYVGKVGSYDTEALVLHFHEGNYFDEADLPAWINSQPITDLFFSGGIDYGFDDQDSCVIFLASQSKAERFLMYEYKGNRTGITDFADKVKLGISRVAGNPIFSKAVDKQITFYCDTEGLGKKITYEFASQFGLSVQQAYQGQPDVMLEMLQDDVKMARVKVRRPVVLDGKKVESELEQEGRKIVFARDPVTDALTRRVDDDAFHPEITKAALYALRYVWLKSKVKMGGNG